LTYRQNKDIIVEGVRMYGRFVHSYNFRVKMLLKAIYFKEHT